MSHAKKLQERVVEQGLRQETHNTENQFGFMLHGNATFDWYKNQIV